MRIVLEIIEREIIEMEANIQLARRMGGRVDVEFWEQRQNQFELAREILRGIPGQKNPAALVVSKLPDDIC